MKVSQAWNCEKKTSEPWLALKGLAFLGLVAVATVLCTALPWGRSPRAVCYSLHFIVAYLHAPAFPESWSMFLPNLYLRLLPKPKRMALECLIVSVITTGCTAAIVEAHGFIPFHLFVWMGFIVVSSVGSMVIANKILAPSGPEERAADLGAVRTEWQRQQRAPADWPEGNEFSAPDATPLTMSQRVQLANNYVTMGPGSAFTAVLYIVLLAVVPSSPVVQLGLTLAQNLLQVAMKQVIVFFGQDYAAEPRFKYSLVLFFHFIADFINSASWASFSVTTYVVLNLFWALSLCAYVPLAGAKGVAFTNWVRLNLMCRKQPSKLTQHERRYHAGICIFITNFSAIMSSIFWLVAVPIMRYHPDNEDVFPMGTLSESSFALSMIFAAVNIPWHVFTFWLASYLLQHQIAREDAAAALTRVSQSPQSSSGENTEIAQPKPVEQIEPLRQGLLLINHYFRFYCSVLIVGVYIAVLFLSQPGQIIYYLFTDVGDAFKAGK